MSEIRKVKSIDALNFIDERTSQLRVEFDNGDTAIMFALYTDVATFIDKEVIVSFRQEMVNNKIENVVVTWAERSTVTTLDKEREIKLYANEMPDIGSNVLFTNINEGDFRQNCIVFCDSVWKGSSSKATWVSLRILDKKRNVAELKVFNPENSDISVYAKNYIVCDIIRNKHGFNTQAVYVKEGISISANPEVALARQYILNAISGDKALLETVQEIGILDAMERYSPVDYTAESGALTIQTAIELSLARDMMNLSKKVDVQHLHRLIVMSKAYVFTHKADNPMSKELQSIFKATSCKKVISRKLLAALEENPLRTQLERSLYDHISKIAVTLVQSELTTGLLLSSDRIWE